MSVGIGFLYLTPVVVGTGGQIACQRRGPALRARHVPLARRLLADRAWD
jgi:hypothetical protein